MFFFFKQKTAYEMRISDWSSDVCSSDLFEQMQAGAIRAVFADRPSPFEHFDRLATELVDVDLPLALRYFGGAGLAHMREFGTRLETFAMVRAKASRHAEIGRAHV